jgi:hypothetical protein
MITQEVRFRNRGRYPGGKYALVLRLIVEGSDALALHVYWRLVADRAPMARINADALGWADIAARALEEGVIKAEEVDLLLGFAAGEVLTLTDGREEPGAIG